MVKKKWPKRKTPRVPTVAFYLGMKPVQDTRRAALDALAVRLGVENRSVMLQMIADGLLDVMRKGE